MYVCAYERHAVARKPFITFSETLQLVRACKRKKNFPLLAQNNVRLLVHLLHHFFKNQSFWSLDEVVGDLRIHVRASITLLLENRSLLFSETLQLVRACKREKNVPSAFLKKIPVLPILAKNCPKLAILAQNAQKWRFFAFFS